PLSSFKSPATPAAWKRVGARALIVRFPCQCRRGYSYRVLLQPAQASTARVIALPITLVRARLLPHCGSMHVGLRRMVLSSLGGYIRGPRLPLPVLVPDGLGQAKPCRRGIPARRLLEQHRCDLHGGPL